jgi:hypothetical protein
LRDTQNILFYVEARRGAWWWLNCFNKNFVHRRPLSYDFRPSSCRACPVTSPGTLHSSPFL